GPATFTVTAGNTISLTGANDFPGSVVFAGAGLTTVNVHNTDFQSKFTGLTFPGTVTDLTVTFDNASIVLPALNLGNLNVTALGIVQQPGTALTVGAGTFSVGAFALDLSNSGNDFGNLTVSNSGRNAVTVVDANAVAFSGNSAVGTGRLSVTAGGSITAIGGSGGRITQNGPGPAGEITLTSTTGSINLPNNNAFRGPLSVSVTGANTVNIHNNNVAMVLGNATTGTGNFLVDAGSQGIGQDPNSVLNFGGPASFTAATSITLTNRTNTFGRP